MSLLSQLNDLNRSIAEYKQMLGVDSGAAQNGLRTNGTRPVRTSPDDDDESEEESSSEPTSSRSESV